VDAFDQHIPAGRPVVGGNGHGFHAPLVLSTLAIHLREDSRQRYPFAGADMLDGHIQLNDSSQAPKGNIPGADLNCIAATANRKIYRRGAGFRLHDYAAVHGDGGGREIHGIPFRIGIGDAGIDRLCAAGLGGVPDDELQRGIFADTPRAGIFHRRALALRVVTVPLLGAKTLEITKSALTTS